ncbi:MAG: hypothetical protein ACYS6Z_11005, partial [Planctomycetota bacterium]
MQRLASPSAAERDFAQKMLVRTIFASCKCVQVLDDRACPRTERIGEFDCDLRPLAPLVEAQKSDDPEVRRRAKGLLALIWEELAYKGLELCRMWEFLPECPDECPHNLPEGNVAIFCFVKELENWWLLKRTPGRCRIWRFCAHSLWEKVQPPLP